MNSKSTTKRICQITAACIALLMVICMMLPALHADVLFEPMDKFYQNHREDMTYIDKVYIANETANGYESPLDDDVVTTASGGTRLYISHAYTDGNGVTWGVYDVDWTTCWFRLDELEPVYDTRDFIIDHEPDFTLYDGQLSDLPSDFGEMPLWKYPGSSDRSGRIFSDEGFDPANCSSFVYTDFAGRDWVYIPYFHGSEGWINADDPTNTEPVVFDANATAETPAPTEEPAAESVAPQPTKEPAPTETPNEVEVNEPAEDKDNSPVNLRLIALILIAVLAVGLVVVISILLIVVFFVLNKKKAK